MRQKESSLSSSLSSEALYAFWNGDSKGSNLMSFLLGTLRQMNGDLQSIVSNVETAASSSELSAQVEKALISTPQAKLSLLIGAGPQLRTIKLLLESIVTDNETQSKSSS